jgi:hypothetical protein
MTNIQLDPNTRISPKKDRDYWLVSDWQSAKNRNDWDTMIRIFRDRINNRYLLAVQELLQADQAYLTRRLGFAIMALDCLLVETLHQYYAGMQESPRGGSDIRLNGKRASNIRELGKNGQFYCRFFTEASFKFTEHFNNHEKEAVFFYQDIRCGILHSGETGHRSLIRVHKRSDVQSKLFELTDQEDGIILFRDIFHGLLVEEFEEYCDRLKNIGEKELRKHFVRKMGYICGLDYEDGEIQ